MTAPKMQKGASIKVAIVHDWLVGGGAEQVVLALHRMYPEAPIYASYTTEEWRKKLNNKVVTGFLQRWPFSTLRKFLPILRIWWFAHLDLSGYDVIISSSGNGEAFGVKTGKNTIHVNYCHTPTHYYWRHFDVYRKNPGFGVLNPLARFGLQLLVGPLRQWDYKAAQRADYMVANSTHIQKDIKKYYGRESVVIYPPVDIARFSMPEPKTRQGFVVAGRQVPQKHTHIAIEACNTLGLPLTVIGKGPEHEALVRLGGPTITYKKEVSNQEMPALFANAEAFIFTSLDDFGVTPVEALAAGTPVIALKAGGALDYVQEGKTGLFFSPQSAEALAKTLKSFNPKQFNHEVIRKSAQQFSPEEFTARMSALIERALNERKK